METLRVMRKGISIHALRVEGDSPPYTSRIDPDISIHALRVEGDTQNCLKFELMPHFYPRPPGGGRPVPSSGLPSTSLFLSTPSGWRATIDNIIFDEFQSISIHALRVEGDIYGGQQCHCLRISIHALRVEGDHTEAAYQLAQYYLFLSTPSGWRATAKTDKVFVCFCAKGRRICLFKTRKEKICRWRFKKDKFWVLIWCEGSGKSVCALASHCG